MIRNIPRHCTEADVLASLSLCGFAGTYDCFDMPGCGRPGYAFVNSTDPDMFTIFQQVFRGFRFHGEPRVKGKRSCDVVPACIQGLELNKKLKELRKTHPHSKTNMHRFVRSRR